MKKIFSRSLLLFIVAAVGLADSLFLTLTHNSGPITCTITKGCDVVLDSKYAELPGGYPTAMLGIIFYAMMMIGALAMALSVNSNKIDQLKKINTVVSIIGICGVIASAVFLGLQAFVIKSWCQYCLLSAVTSTICAGLAVTIRMYARNNRSEQAV